LTLDRRDDAATPIVEEGGKIRSLFPSFSFKSKHLLPVFFYLILEIEEWVNYGASAPVLFIDQRHLLTVMNQAPLCGILPSCALLIPSEIMSL